MKIKVLTFILLFSILYSKGQTIESISIKGGISLANHTWQFGSPSFEIKYDYKPGLYSVLNAELFNGKYLSLSTDIGFVQKGMQQELEITTNTFPEGTGEYTTLKTTIDYITFSPMLKGSYRINGWTAYALIGPRIDYNIGHKYEFQFAENVDLKKDIYGINYGVGAEYKIKRIGVLLEFIGQPNFTMLMNKKPSETSTGLKITENAYIITTGLKYYLH